MLGRRQLIAVFIALLSATAGAQTAGTPVRQAQTGKTSGSLTATAAAAVNCGGTSCVTVSTIGYSVATVTVHGTYSGATLNFEFSDDGGTTYYPFQCSEANAAAQESSKAPGTNASMAWDCGVYAATNFEVRQSAISTGTAVVNVSLSAAAIEPALTVAGTFWQATQPVSGTVAATQSGNWTDRIVGNAGAAVDAATAAAPPANAIAVAGLASGATGGTMELIPVCDSYKVVSVSTATTTLLVTGVSGRQVRICSLHLITTLADNAALIEGTGATCGTGSAGMAGGTTAASGYNLAANGGLTLGSGIGTVMMTATAGDSVCIVTSASTQLSGGVSYAIY